MRYVNGCPKQLYVVVDEYGKPIAYTNLALARSHANSLVWRAKQRGTEINLATYTLKETK